MTLSAGATWINRDQIAVIDRTQGLTITWSGGDPSSQVAVIAGMASNPATNVSGAFACVTPLDPFSFTVPPDMLANLPSTAGNNKGMQSSLMFLTFPSGDKFATFTTSAPALDKGMGAFVAGELRNNVTYK